ncbi:MAG: alpha/beta hydrolase, partial [Rhodoferax sp.]
PDRREPLPLPDGVACFTVAATAAAQRSPLADRVVGDGLVPLASALGQHDDPRHQLAFAKYAQTIVYRTHHMELLYSPVVTQQLLNWLK